MGKEAIIMGIVFILFGTFLIPLTKFNPAALFYGIPSIAIGIALIILHKEEDKVEQRTDLVKKDSTKNLKPKKTR